MDYVNNYNGAILIVDLETGETTNEDLELDLMEKCLGGAALNLDLYQKYADRDPVVLGTGLFTATFVPASCLIIIITQAAGYSRSGTIGLLHKNNISSRISNQFCNSLNAIKTIFGHSEMSSAMPNIPI